MVYIKIPKPASKDYLEKQDGDYLLLQNGGRIILRGIWSRIAKPLASYTKIAKPSIP